MSERRVAEHGSVVEEYRRQGPRTARDRVLDLLMDGRFHSANELEFLPEMRPGEWVGALRDLIDLGYTFGRRSESFIMRRRGSDEERPVLSELLRGIDATIEEDLNLAPVRAPGSDDGEPEEWRGQRDGWIPEDDLGPTPEAKEEKKIALGDVMRISPDLVLPAREAVTMTFAVLAKKGSGKTYLAMVMAEEFLACGDGMPFVVLDPTGVWWGLRALADGNSSRWGVLTLGGKKGLPLEPKQGKEVAKLLQELWPRPAIIDISGMEREEQHAFAADFGSMLYETNEKPRHIIVDEADEFMPQYPDSTYRHQKRALGAYDRIVRRGRIRGLGATLITQRSAVIHKNVLSQVDGLFVLNMVSPADLKAVEDWMTQWIDAGDRRACLRALPKLGQGEAFFMQAGSDHKFRKIVVRKKETWDSSRTPSMDDLYPPEPALAPALTSDVDVSREHLGSRVMDEAIPDDLDLGEEGVE